MDGTWSLKNASKASPTEWAISWWEAALLLGSGVLVVVLHQFLRFPLHLAGRHGIEWMALLIMGRASSRFRGAGSLASVGASIASFLPGLRGDDPYIWIVYLLPGLAMDAAFYYLPRYANKLWFLIALGGLAHITKPLSRLVFATIFGWLYGSFRNGVLYPVATHLLFGLIGGLLGGLVVVGIKRLSDKT